MKIDIKEANKKFDEEYAKWNKRDECSGEPIPFGGWVQYSDDTVAMVYDPADARKIQQDIADQLTKQINKTKHDPVNNPKHYTSHPSGVECIEITRHMGFNLGNVMKYIWRAGLKDVEVTDKDLEDLKKAMWYLQDEIAVREEKRNV
jgi:hypothetical protein